MVDEKSFEKIIERERAARCAAEARLEQKSLELYEKSSSLESCLEEIREMNSLLTDIMTAAPDGIITCSADFIIQGCNQTMARQLACKRSEVILSHLDDFFVGLSRYLAIQKPGVFDDDRLVAQKLDGQTYPVELRGHVGNISKNIRYVLVVHDITTRMQSEAKRKEMEQQMDEARRLEAIGALSAGIAHEINTPIQFIGDNIGFLQDAIADIFQSYTRYENLRSAVADGEQYQSQVSEIDAYNEQINLQYVIQEIDTALSESKEGIDQVRDIILLMKEFAHPGSGKKDTADLNLIVQNVVTISRNRQKNTAQVICDYDEFIPHIKCRRGQIQQVILNIVLNAIDAVDDGREELGKVLVKTSYDDEVVRVAVSDNGSGVPESLKQKIFDPFFTTKPVGKGTGQGLALAKEYIVKGHNGRLSLADTEGYATTFVIELPIHTTTETTGEESKEDVAA